MIRKLIDVRALKAIALPVAAAGILGMAGCATGNGGGTAAMDESSQVKGRDLGRGGATSGGVSSLDPSGNAADYSIYDAQHTHGQQ